MSRRARRQERRAARQNKKAERKGNRQAKRQERKETRQSNRDARNKRKNERKIAKFESKNDRKKHRQTQKTSWVNDRQKSKQTAYENGIDPHKWIADSISAGANATSNILGKNPGGALGVLNDGVFGTGNSAPTGATGGLDFKKMLPLILIGGYFLLKKKK